MGYQLSNGRSVYVIAEGRLVNLAAGDGHPAEIMDMSFAIQALSALWLVKHGSKGRMLGDMVIPVPEEIDKRVALMELESRGLEIDTLTIDQERYLNGWRE